jgi:hypothetical protein
VSKKKKVINVENLFDIPYKNVGVINFERAGQTLSLKIQSLNEYEQEDLREMFPQPEAPLKKKRKLDDNGNPIMITKGPLAGKHVMEDVRDYEDKDFQKAHAKYITDVAAGAAALGLQIKWVKPDENLKEEDIDLPEKIKRLKGLFNYDSINFIGQEVLRLSTVTSVDLEEAVKN